MRVKTGKIWAASASLPLLSLSTHRFNNRRRYLVIARIVVDTRCRLVVTKFVAAGRMGRRCRHVLPCGVVGRALQGNVRSRNA